MLLSPSLEVMAMSDGWRIVCGQCGGRLNHSVMSGTSADPVAVGECADCGRRVASDDLRGQAVAGDAPDDLVDTLGRPKQEGTP